MHAHMCKLFFYLLHITLISPRSPWRQHRQKGRDHSAIGRGAKLAVATRDGRIWLLPVTGELNNVASPSVTRAGWRMLLGVRPSSSRELHGSAASWREEASGNSIEDITSLTQALEGCHLLDPQGLSACFVKVKCLLLLLSPQSQPGNASFMNIFTVLHLVCYKFVVNILTVMNIITREEALVNSIETITSVTQALGGCHLLDPQGLSACFVKV